MYWCKWFSTFVTLLSLPIICSSICKIKSNLFLDVSGWKKVLLLSSAKTELSICQVIRTWYSKKLSVPGFKKIICTVSFHNRCWDKFLHLSVECEAQRSLYCLSLTICFRRLKLLSASKPPSFWKASVRVIEKVREEKSYLGIDIDFIWELWMNYTKRMNKFSLSVQV